MALTKKQRLQRWVDALRSRKYKQGKHQLRTERTDENGVGTGKYDYCCLGVLCDLENPKGWGKGSANGGQMDSMGGPPGTINKRVGLNGSIEIVDSFGDKADEPITDKLATMNDQDNKTFHQIAKWIEKNLIAKL